MSEQRSTDDARFMNALEAASRLRTDPFYGVIPVFVLLLVIAFIIWANVTRTPEITRGSGKVVPSVETQIVQSLEGGILSSLMVREGDRVRQGQTLARINNVAFTTDQGGIEARLSALELKQARLNAEAEGETFEPSEALVAGNPDLAENELNLYRSRMAEYRNSLSILEDRVRQSRAAISETRAEIEGFTNSRALIEEELRITRGLVASRAVPRLEQIRLERELSSLDGSLNSAQQRINRLNAELSAARRELTDQRASFRSQALSELSEVKTQIAAFTQSLRAASDRVDRTELKAPVDGVVKTVHIKTLGGIVEPAKPLVEIVPVDEALKITARIAPADIAFIDVGQDVKVKITAYDPQRFGSLEGRLTRISADTVQDQEGQFFFEVDVETDKSFLGSDSIPLPIIPGMQAEVEVITGDRSVMEYLIKPLLRARDRAMTER